MGSTLKMLHKSKLPARELHHSRLFVDLAENIHIHHREFRTVFSLDEYFEYAHVVAESTKDVRNFLLQNEDYEEQQYPTTIMIAGGKEQQLRYLKNSPKPNQSVYFDNEFAIELQDGFVTDEIHIHFRDFRIALDRERFKHMARGFTEALTTLEKFENDVGYLREHHPDHVVAEFNDNKDHDTKILGLMGIDAVKVNDISSPHFKSERAGFDEAAVLELRKKLRNNEKLEPICISTEPDGTHYIIDGHHRFLAHVDEGYNEIPAIKLDLTFLDTEDLRKAELFLKKFDIKTKYKYDISGFFKFYLACKTNKFYKSAYATKMKRYTLLWRLARMIKRKLFGKRRIFKSFNEAHNHHN